VPVVVTGADTPLGAAVVDRLVGRGLDLRATVDTREQVAALVARGVRTAVSDLVDTERFGAVIEGAHTVVHLRGGVASAHLGLDDVVAALPDSGVARVVVTAPLGADIPAGLRSAGVDVVVLRVGVVAAGGALESAVGSWSRAAPIDLADLADAVVAADRLRTLSGWVEVDAVGPDEVTARGLRAAFGRGAVAVGDGGEAMARVLGVRARSVGSPRG
jgi:uncharacterized protein YbjT (DUF2867 family)